MNRTLTEMAIDLAKTKDFSKVYEFLNEIGCFEKNGHLSIEGRHLLCVIIDLSMRLSFKCKRIINPFYSGDIGYQFWKNQNEYYEKQMIEFATTFSKSKKDWKKEHRQYIDLDIYMKGLKLL